MRSLDTVNSVIFNDMNLRLRKIVFSGLFDFHCFVKFCIQAHAIHKHPCLCYLQILVSKEKLVNSFDNMIHYIVYSISFNGCC